MERVSLHPANAFSSVQESHKQHEKLTPIPARSAVEIGAAAGDGAGGTCSVPGFFPSPAHAVAIGRSASHHNSQMAERAALMM
jgi:hypothetical protein